jgi:hypothetical protein
MATRWRIHVVDNSVVVDEIGVAKGVDPAFLKDIRFCG